MPQVIGKVVKSNSHLDYVCQVYGPGETASTPLASDYAFGKFVRILIKERPKTWLVGLIYDTVLLNPEFGRLGPRLSSPPELAVFSPDYLNEKAVLVGIVVIGTINSRNQVNQSVPRLAASTDTLVELMPESQIRQFHEIGSSLRLTYAPRLLTHESPLTTYLLQTTLEKLSLMNPPLVQQPLIELISDLLVWQAQILPFAGAK